MSTNSNANKNNTPLLELEQVSVRVNQHAILQSVNLQVHPQEILTLIGPNGAGKTTLVRVVLGLINFSGKRNLRKNLCIGYMPQKLQLNPELPLTLKRFLQLSGADEHSLQKRSQQTGIKNILLNPMQNISGGELQRVLLARALLKNPDLLVLDEPAQGVDLQGQAEMYKLIHDIKTEQQCGVLMVSHDLHWVMAQTDKVICLNQHVCCYGHPDHVSSDPEFINLFGKEIGHSLAPYKHHHDHQHDLHGNVLNEDPQKYCSHNPKSHSPKTEGEK